MVTYTATQVVASKAKFARRVSLGGLAVMLPGFFFGVGGMFNPALQGGEFIGLAYISLILGTIIATYLTGFAADHYSYRPVLIVASILPVIAGILLMLLIGGKDHHSSFKPS